ncbi:S9 family peptidase [Simiduia litorea]|uniref:alpha/beta hydrolase family protein n=1 Tax=Simiduia litorea TaxID=1435348 RepID=UPI0036F249A7
MRAFYLIVLCALSFGINAKDTLVKDIPLDDFIKQGDYLEMTLSPSGKYIAARIRQDDRVMAIFIDRKAKKVIGALNPSLGSEVHRVRWVSDEKVVFEYAERRSSLDWPVPTGEIYVANFDGRFPKLLAGYNAGEQTTGSHIKRKEYTPASFQMINSLPSDPNRILVIEHPWSQKGDSWWDLRRRLPVISTLDVRNGSKRKSETLPFRDPSLLTTRDGEIRFATWVEDNGVQKAAYRKSADDDWIILMDENSEFLVDASALWLDNAAKKAYLWGRYGEKGFMTIYELEFSTQKLTPLFTDLDADIADWEYDPATGEIIVGVTFFEKAKYHYTDANSEAQKAYKKLTRAFDGSNISIVSRTEDNSHMLIRVNSDINPGEYYYFNRLTNKADFLWANWSWIDPRDMLPIKTEVLAARDGVAIPVRITLPTKHEGAPLVVLIHGGPHGVSDDWTFDPEVQLLANRGFAVLQVNFRGSGNFGSGFMQAGYRQWGGKIIDDIYDATQWTLANYNLGADRICAYGASFGGYASLMLAAKYPDLLKCAVGYVGIYDLNLMFSSGDIPMRWGGEAYLQRVLGTDEKELSNFSPINHVEKIKANVMLVHGEEDIRAPVEHAELMRKALKKAGKDPEWLLYDRSGHGVRGLNDRRELYTKLLDFLSENTRAVQ